MEKKDNPIPTNPINVTGLSIILEFMSFIMIAQKKAIKISSFKLVALCCFKNE
ncbi:hypothetical protein D3C87_1733530 [compost metagenome]